MEFIVLALLFLLNGFFALSEIALVSSRKSRLDQMKSGGVRGAATALQLLEDSETFLSAIQVGITLIGIIAGVYGGVSLAEDFIPVLKNFKYTEHYASQIALSLTVIVITYFSVLIGELVPKTIALSKPEKIAVKVAPVIVVLKLIFYPVVKIFSLSTSIINKILRIKPRSYLITEEELRHSIKTASHQGVIEKSQKTIHEKVFYFADKKAKHIMTHRMDVEWIDLDQDVSEIHLKILNSKHNKLVCCHRDLDHFIGVLYLKDYFISLDRKKTADIEELAVKALITHENSDAQDVLDLFKKEHKHFSIVVDEYGSFEGIITIHDIMESIIGELPDSNEPLEPDILIRDDGTVLVNGDAPVEVLASIMENFEIDFEKIDYSTVAGFVVNNLHQIPKAGDGFEYMDYHIDVIDIDNNRIDKILVTKKTES